MGLTKVIKGDTLKKETWEKLGMKFDKIIMNPPYDRNLHLKILEECLKHIKNDGEIINLSPIRWLQDPLAEFEASAELKIRQIPALSRL